MARVLIHSNALWVGTGYGVQTRLLAEALTANGHRVINSCNYGLSGSPLTVNGIEMTGTTKDQWGNDMLRAHQQFYEPDVTIGLFDLWVLKPEVIKSLENYWHWIPIDHDPIPPEVAYGASLVSGGIIAMSKFGYNQLPTSPTKIYIPHAVDSAIFKPLNKQECRKMVGFPEGVFVVGMFMANKGAPSRKAFDQQIRAYAKFQKHHKNAMLYIHSDITGYHGENLEKLVEFAGEKYGIKLNVRFVSQYHYINNRIGFEEMATLYNACDVVMNATRGEGFGVPIIESQACGTPVIVTDFSAMPELVRDGYKVGYTDLIYTPQESYQCNPDISQLYEALIFECYNAEKSDERRVKLATQIESEFGIKNVYDTCWKPFMEVVEREKA